jgi:phosphoglycolate phosphatase-like HAD superfamily hydrolase
MAIDAILFDKDGVLLDLNQTWFLTICNIAKYTEGLIDSRVTHRALLAAIGVELMLMGNPVACWKTALMPLAPMAL